MTDNPAALLRQAAEKLREHATTATAGPWHTHGAYPESIHGLRCMDVVAGGRWGGEASCFESEKDAGYIALMHPGVGAALADWLENTAVKLHHSTHPEWQENVEPHAFAVARQVLGVAE